MISVSVRHRQGDFTLDAAFEAGTGVTALFGPSGSGKTTLVQIIAGLRRPDSGKIVFNGTIWNDSVAKTFLPPHKRKIGYVFQEGRLFPHMSVAHNLAYGRFFAGRGDGGLVADDVIALLGIKHLLHRRPAELSGGEKQRVAIGRALLAAPGLILMDEPLSALDKSRRQEILPYIEHIRDVVRVPIIYVSHQLDEVARLANQVVLLDQGLMRKSGTPVEVFPEIIGDIAPQSILEGRISGHEPYYGVSIADVGEHIVTLQPVDLPEGTLVRFRVAATDVILALDQPRDVSALNHLAGDIVAIERKGQHVLVSLDCGGQRLASRITLLSAERLMLRVGMRVHALFKAVAVDSASVFHEGSSGE
jgi:molybdate transport system ATP-binding protein